MWSGRTPPAMPLFVPAFLEETPARTPALQPGYPLGLVASRMQPASGVQAADAAGFGDTRHAEHIRRQAHVDLLVGVDLEHVGEGPGHYLLQFRVDILLIPEEVVFVLHPLEVADRHATGVTEDVRDQEYALLVEDAVGFRGHWAVGRLGDDFGVNGRRVHFGDGVHTKII